ncbi:MAG: hypothetical protein A3B13_00120 [Candidatus Liptonbacteria bacterium RIFCSPLOWO2_01_FULL_45_15]|uniref:N-acetyltransferase domain-containing protein n=1 Tax=Candidatus Liptonbacteria bacterium RIFCSPLOWO2_01_FULL_45_15 TaxID=1798649 RepID=A0A1G2CFN8_9BACT|nr:MAG: hypothetical protein A3B13_00120 [Candidatus Liptonbacteria bacterium RIFCSPLOWO2_01_FULL_45_15]
MLEIIENQGVDKLSLPLPIYTSVVLASARSDDGEKFEIVAGLGKNFTEEIKKHALDKNDTELRKNTSDSKRFGEGSYDEWYAKNRTIFGLINKKTGALAAIVWLGPKPLGRKSLRYLPKEELEKENEQKVGQWHTLVYRSYNPFRGKGLMKDFVKFAMKIYSASYPDAHYWVGFSEKNKASMALASSLGFTISKEASDRPAGWLAMIK